MPEVTQVRSLLRFFRPLSATYLDGITSRFNRDPVTPGVGYQLGWGNVDEFRAMDGDTAATLTDRSTWTLGSGVVLPGGGGVQVGYQQTDAETLDTRSDRRTRQRSWPDLQARLPALPMPGFTGIRAISFSSGITKTTRNIEFGGTAQQRRFDEDVRVPLDISITWLSTLVTSYQGLRRTGRGQDPTGDTERDESSHRFSLNTELLPPGALARRLDRPVRVSVLAGYTSERNCRITAAGAECVAFLDQVRRTVNLSVDTSVGGFEFGFQLSFDDRQSAVGQQTGSTQFQVGLFGQLDFAAGALPIR
jgi:hypothetical protein